MPSNVNKVVCRMLFHERKIDEQEKKKQLPTINHNIAICHDVVDETLAQVMLIDFITVHCAITDL